LGKSIWFFSIDIRNNENSSLTQEKLIHYIKLEFPSLLFCIVILKSEVTFIADQIASSILDSATSFFLIQTFVTIFLLAITLSILYISIIRDIRRERITSLERQKLIERRREFISKTAHELRTPLTIIKGFSEHLLKIEDSHSHIDKLNTMMKSINRLEGLIDNVSDLYQLERGKLDFSFEQMDLIEFLAQILKPLVELYHGEIIFDQQSITSPILIKGDKNRLIGVIYSVLENAIENTYSANREIKIGVETNTSRVKVKISDNGAGISPENLDMIFEKFRSIPTKFRVVGTGIGLHIAREVVTAHGGTIKAYSEGEDKGTTLTITLPIVSPKKTTSSRDNP